MNKGFTLVELLAVIVLLAIIMLFSFKSVQGVREDALKDALKTKVASIEKQASIFAQDNQKVFKKPSDYNGHKCTTDDYAKLTDRDNMCKTEKQTKVNHDSTTTPFCVVITVKDLVDLRYYETGDTTSDNKPDVKNNMDNTSMLNDEIIIYRKNNRIYATMADFTFRECQVVTEEED